MARHYARRTGEEADDLLQEAWLVLFEALTEVDVRIGRPEQYLLQRARWGVLDAVRRARLRRAAPLDEATEPSEASSDVPLSDFVARLPAAQQRVAAGLLAGHTFRELGAQLGCTSANIAYHADRLREELRRWSNESAEPPGTATAPAR